MYYVNITAKVGIIKQSCKYFRIFAVNKWNV